MTSQTPILCQACTRFDSSGVCEAFPRGIPTEIVVYGADHRAPLTGDHGITFEQRETEAARRAFQDWKTFDEA